MAESSLETIRLGPLVVPRLFVGLWQLSSNAWGSVSAAKVRQGMNRHVALGYTAFGKSSITHPLPSNVPDLIADMVRLSTSLVVVPF